MSVKQAGPSLYDHLAYISTTSLGLFLTTLWSVVAFLALAIATDIDAYSTTLLLTPSVAIGGLSLATLWSSLADYQSSENLNLTPLEPSYLRGAFIGYVLIGLGIAICITAAFISTTVANKPSYPIVWLTQVSILPTLYSGFLANKNWPTIVPRRVYIAYIADKIANLLLRIKRIKR
jgi:hypothetical protein